MSGKFMIKSGVTFEVPNFYEKDPVLWFYLLEILFKRCSIESSGDKYDVTLLSLGSEKSFTALHQMRNLILGQLSVSSSTPYETFKSHVINFTLEPEIVKLGKQVENGNLKPTEFLKRIKDKFGYPWNADSDIKQIFIKYLPTSLQELKDIIEQDASLETIVASLDISYNTMREEGIIQERNSKELARRSQTSYAWEH